MTKSDGSQPSGYMGLPRETRFSGTATFVATDEEGTERGQEQSAPYYSPEAVVRSYIYMATVEGRTEEAIMRYMSPNFIQHSPYIGPGRQGLLDHLIARYSADSPGYKPDNLVLHVISEGNLVLVHHLMKFAPDDPGRVDVDIMRVEGDKIVERWGVNEPFPEDWVL